MEEVRKRPRGEGEEAPAKKRPRVQSRKKKPGLDREVFAETMYYIRNGLRYVKPYYFNFLSHAKGRWVGFTVYDVFCREFQAETPEFYEKAIKAGKVTVNDKVATMATVIYNNDLLCHRVHRHEPPVTAQPLKILHCDEKLVVLDKPSSIPVHPCGRYRHNTVIVLLGKEHNLRNLHTIHRLDRLTSGLLIFARTLEASQQLDVQIRERQVTKEYVCRVQGEFPSEPVECNEPILVVSHKLGLCRVDPSGKLCSTMFSRLSYNGSSSVVKCIPRTGRMHQLRVHLQWLGFPIMNDPLYNHAAWGPARGKHGEGMANMDQIITEIRESKYPTESESALTDACQQQDHLAKEDTGQVATKNTSSSSMPERSRSDTSRPSDSIEIPVANTVYTQMQSSHVVRSTFQNESGAPVAAEKHCTSSDGWNLSLPACLDTKEPELVSKETQPQVPTELNSRADSGQPEPPLATTSTAELGEEEREPGDTDLLARGSSSGSDGQPVIEKPEQKCQGVGEKQEFDPDCTECRTVRPDPTPKDLIMYLHALSYKGPDWEFSTEMPAWASSEWVEPHLL